MNIIGQTRSGTILAELSIRELTLLVDFPTNTDEVGRRIISYRKANKINQQAMANSLGISRNYLSLIENENAPNISWQIYKRIVAILEGGS